MKKIDLSIVIVNFNTYDLTKKCLESIFHFTKECSYEVIVVDNFSTDDSRLHFENDERITYIYEEVNHGFGKANNIGASIASGKYILFLNSDTILTENVLPKLLNFADTVPEGIFGAVGICMVDIDNNDMQSFGEFVSSKRIYKRMLESIRFSPIQNYSRNIYDQIDKFGFAEVDFVSGADLMVFSDNFRSLNGFDPDYFMYYEETDLQYRMFKRNMKRYVINQRSIIHLEGGSFSDKISFKRKLMITTSLNLYITKHFKWLYKLQITLLSMILLICDLFKQKYTVKENFSLLSILLKNK